MVKTLNTEALQKIKLLYDPERPLLCIYPIEIKSVFWRDIVLHVYCNTIHNSEKIEA